MTHLHVVGLPHTNLTDRFSWCAYTGKVRRFPKMMEPYYDTTVYHSGEFEENEDWWVGGYTRVLTEKEREARFGDAIPVFDEAMFSTFNKRVIYEIAKTIEPHDIICLSAGGHLQREIAEAFPGNITCEFGVGYEGVFANFICFESYAWMHTVYGWWGGANKMDGRFYDVVIPNYYDLKQFPQVPDYDDRGDYLLYLARLDDRKGIRVACEVAKHAGIRLVTAGSGTPPDGVDHQGIVGPAQRAELLAGARALIQPTMFLEPFGGSVVEAMLCGLPVITTDWGAFTETVRNGVDGYRCRTLAEFVSAVRSVDALPISEKERATCAAARWSMDVVGAQYDRWFQRLDSLHGAGWYSGYTT